MFIFSIKKNQYILQFVTSKGYEAAKNSKNENIKLAISAKILGMTFQNNLKWSAYFEKGGEAVINKCKRKFRSSETCGEGLFD